MSDEWYEAFNALREQRQKEGSFRRRRTAVDWSLFVAPLAEIGLILRQHSDVHYSITHVQKGWRLNVYPGNCRIYGDRNRPRAPFLGLPTPWTLADLAGELQRLAAAGWPTHAHRRLKR